MGRIRSRSNAPASWGIFLAFLCVVLVVVCGTIQLVHTHPQGDVSRADCALCATAHVVVQISAPSVTLRVTPVVAMLEAPAPPVRFGIFSTFALFTRPPPVDVVLA